MILHDEAPGRGAALDHARRLGATTVRINAIWHEIQEDGWGDLDAAVDATRARGLRVQLTLMGTPVYNLYGWRSTDPAGLFEPDDAVGPENDEHLACQAEQAGVVIAAWGATRGPVERRAEHVLELLGPVHCLKVTKDGHPWHPLYIRADQQPIPYTARAEAA